MFFVLSKLLLILIFPTMWICVAFAFALFSKRKNVKRLSLICGCVLFLIFSNPLLLNCFARVWDINTKTENKHYSAAIVLGGFSSEDENGNGFFNNAADRFIQAALLKSTGKVDYILLTGGNSEIIPGKFRESAWAANQLKSLNVDAGHILIENNARNTYENARLSKDLLASKQLQPPYLLVTSAFHMRRSLYTFEKAGISVLPYSCNYIAGHATFSSDSLIPDAGTLATWNVYIKELIGLLVYKLKA